MYFRRGEMIKTYSLSKWYATNLAIEVVSDGGGGGLCRSAPYSLVAHHVGGELGLGFRQTGARSTVHAVYLETKIIKC